MEEKTKEKCYSIDGELFTKDYSDLCDELEFMYGIGEHEIFEAYVEPLTHADFISAWTLIDCMRDNAYEESCDEDYLKGFSDDDEKELEKLVCDWITEKFGAYERFRAVNIRRITIDI